MRAGRKRHGRTIGCESGAHSSRRGTDLFLESLGRAMLYPEEIPGNGCFCLDAFRDDDDGVTSSPVMWQRKID